MNFESIIDDFSKIFVKKAFEKYKNKDYLYLTKKFRKGIYDFSLELGFTCRYIIINIFKYFDIINLKKIVYKNELYLKIKVYDKINKLNYYIYCDIDNDDDFAFTYNKLYKIFSSLHKRYMIKKESMNKPIIKQLPKIVIKPVIPQPYAGTSLPFYKWIHSRHIKYKFYT